MTAEFPPPDSRLAGKLAILKLDHVNGGHGFAHVPAAPDDGEGAAEIDRLAKLAPFEYERQRKAAAERLDVRASILDRLVAAERFRFVSDNKQGRALSLPEAPPWRQSVNGTHLLAEL
jgi:hypothetical protein